MESPHLNKVDTEARSIFEKAGWQWDPLALGFRRLARRTESSLAYEQRQRIQPCPDVITLEELERHQLYSEPQDLPVARRVKDESLTWLRSRIEAAEPKP